MNMKSAARALGLVVIGLMYLSSDGGEGAAATKGAGGEGAAATKRVGGEGAAATDSAAVPLVPGYDVEPEKRRQATPANYVTPRHLRYPYLSTYHVQPTVVEGNATTIGWYVTDFRHSRLRFNDRSARFDVELRYAREGEPWKTAVKKNVPSGDGEFNLGKLPVGEYTLGIRCIDRRNKLPSATIYHEFRVVTKSFVTIPPAKSYHMTGDDLAAYGLVQDPGYERRISVNDASIDDYLREHPHQPAKVPGYAVYVPAVKGAEPFRVFEKLKVVYDPGYDTNQVEQAAVRTLDGLQRFLDDKVAAGFREVVLLPGIYRLTAFKSLHLPSNLRVNLNGATLKLNQFTGCRGTMIFFSGAKDAELVNGTLEGDYYAHDYAHSPHKTEWPIMLSFNGYCRNCRLENVTLRDSAAYGAGNGLGIPGGPGKGVTFAADNGHRSFFYVNRDAGFEPGGLDWKTGKLDSRDTYRWTTRPLDIEGLKPFKYLQLSKFLGWQGMRTRNWNYTVCFFDANNRFVSGEVAMQYRFVLIPPEAVTARFSIETATRAEAENSELAVMRIKFPWNCAVRRCRFVHCRVVGYAASAMRNFLFEENEFTRSGEAITTCAFDAEDGADLMQDAFFYRNRFHDNPNNEFLTCAGLNFVIEQNRANIHLHPRTYSPCVRNNICGTASFGCANRNRTGYWRIEGNTITNSLSVGTNCHDLDSDWYILWQNATFADNPDFKVAGGATGRFKNCTFDGVQASPGCAIDCTIRNCKTVWSRYNSGKWKNCTTENSTLVRRDATNVYENCTFSNVYFSCVQYGAQTFDGCTLDNVKFPSFHKNGTREFSGTVNGNCTLRGKNTFPAEMTVKAK